MEKLNQLKYIFLSFLILILLGVMGLAFYWYSYRPEQIRKDCYNIAVIGDFEFVYKTCLLRNGMRVN